MNIQKQFQYDPSIDVTASQIGISKWNWTYIKSNDISEATTIMKKNRFDVLPIENADGLVTSYYSTVEWNNYDHLNISKILEAQTIYYRMSLKDLIKKFMDDKRHFYFLTDYSQILGLVSFVNLNCQLVYNYLFYLLSDIERSVSTLLKNHIHQDTVIMMLKSSTDNHQQEVYKSYIKNVEANQDVDIFQLMYLQSIGITLTKLSNELPDQFKKLRKFAPKFASNGVYNLIRQKVMHPVRPILSDNNSILQMDELFVDYEEIKSILNP